MKLFLKRKSFDDNLELDRGENKIKARRIDKIYKIGACILGVIWVLSLIKPVNFKFNIKDLKNIKYMISEKRGNTLGNDMNRGMTVRYGDYTYYVNFEDDNKIYRVKKGSSVREKISDENAHDLSIVGNNLYYINESDEGKIYRFNIKNNEKKKIIDETATQMQISGNFIYYKKSIGESKAWEISQDGGNSGIDAELNKIFKTKLDGSNIKKVVDERCGRFAVYNGWIYYSNESKGGLLYRITRDGTNNTKLSKDSVWDFWMDNKYIYLANELGRKNTQGITRIKHNGSEEMELYNKHLWSMNIVGDSIYFSSEIGLGKMSKDGKDIKSVVPFSDMIYKYINVVNDYVYYYGIDNGLGRIKTTGKDMENEPEILKEIFVQGIKGEVDDYYGKTLSMYNYRGIYKDKDNIYYEKMGMFSRINLSSGEKSAIISRSTAREMDIIGDYIFYINNDDFSKIYMMNKDGTDNKLFFNEKVSCFKISGDYIYYRKFKDNGRGIYRIKLDGSESTKILGDNGDYRDYVNTVIILKDNIYYDKNGWLYKADLDGKNEIRVLDGGSDRFQVAGDYIYFSNLTREGLCSMNLKTKEIKKILDKECLLIQAEGDYIYAVSLDGVEFYGIKTDGSSTVKIPEIQGYSVLTLGKYIYYTSSYEGTLYRYNTENGEIFDMEQGKLK